MSEDTVATETVEKVKKSIVPTKYANKYKAGGQGPVAEFIKAQSENEGAFDFARFFDLARKNGIPDAKIAEYEGKLGNHGAPGRARMTLGNMLRSIARKNQKLVALDGSEVEVAEAPLPKREPVEKVAA